MDYSTGTSVWFCEGRHLGSIVYILLHARRMACRLDRDPQVSQYLEAVVQPVDRGRVHGADHLQNPVEVVELLEHLQDLDDPRNHCDTFLQVLRLHYAPAGRT